MLRILDGFGLISGAIYPFRAIALLLRKPYLWQYLIIPILVNLVIGILLYGSIIYWGWNTIESFTMTLSENINQAIADLPNWLNFLEDLILFLGWLLKFFLTVIFLIVVGFILLQFGSILGSPWYGKLSEEVEKIRLGNAENIEVGLLEDIFRAVLFELKKILLAVTGGIILFFINFFPGIGTIASTIGGLTLTATIICLDFFDGPLERRRFSFRGKLKMVYGNLPASGSFSFSCLFLISVPLLNLLTIPFCVMGGTLLLSDRVFFKRRKKESLI
ncbi:hypothetical protein FRE64_13630 [Euhalothece natronophila Z-M001]|uniref:EI24 domain-containing protein n=1 Tax=Euhalothece natronophila Z-M001 TaxID=522448 RepID=A0A5B8NRG7_9CHRO|nr:EI24 domain-containing protein [Euhalothece natronophila]QDZ40889.1 hypothetical protein FRE64_13630 [Euhalothece natronophila Z-M001]